MRLTWTQAVNIIAGRLTFVAVHNLTAFRDNEDVQASTAYCIDEELVRIGPAVFSLALGLGLGRHLCAATQVYYPFYKDFGPLNLGLAFRFCRQTAQALQVRPSCSVDPPLQTSPPFRSDALLLQSSRHLRRLLLYVHRTGGGGPGEAPDILHRPFCSVQGERRSAGEHPPSSNALLVSRRPARPARAKRVPEPPTAGTPLRVTLIHGWGLGAQVTVLKVIGGREFLKTLI